MFRDRHLSFELMIVLVFFMEMVAKMAKISAVFVLLLLLVPVAAVGLIVREPVYTCPKWTNPMIHNYELCCYFEASRHRRTLSVDTATNRSERDILLQNGMLVYDKVGTLFLFIF